MSGLALLSQSCVNAVQHDPVYSALMKQIPGCAVYVVGGAVRDALLGLPIQDRDWLVVGASPEAMTAAGFKPVGQDFPVFLHPLSHEEYALARTERKQSAGYQGFQFYAAADVRLEDDLRRRDLTVNAMALGMDGCLHDPYGGTQDLANKVLRHVSPAFSEDPVRLLRLARFYARLWSEQLPWTIAAETIAMCQTMVANGEVGALVAERVWQELSRGLMTSSPSKMLVCLVETQAWPVIAGVQALVQLADATLDQLAQSDWPLAWRWLAWWLLAMDASSNEQVAMHTMIRQHDELAQRWRVPSTCQDLSALWFRLVHMQDSWLGGEGRGKQTHEEKLEALLDVLEVCDVWRRPERLAAIQTVAGKLSSHVPGVLQQHLRALRDQPECIDALRHLPLSSVVAEARTRGESVPEAVRSARLQALRSCLRACLS